MEKSNKKTFIVIILVTLLILSLVVGIYGFINRNKYNDNKNVTSNKIEEDVSSIEDKNYGVFIDSCNEKDCELYKDNNVLVNLKNISKELDTYSCDVYINNKFSYKIKDCGDNLILEKINDGFLIKVASEGFFSYFYLFSDSGNYISDFSEEMKKDKNHYVRLYVENNELKINTAQLVFDGEEDLIKASYCKLEASPTDIFETTNYYKINDNKLEIYKVENITWEGAYKCENGESENCGDITIVKCKNN